MSTRTREAPLVPEPTVALPSLRTNEGRLLWLASVDHKQIGIMYVVVALFFFVVSGVEALLMRLQLAVPDNDWLSPLAYNQLFTMHGTTMIFLVGMPLVAGFGNYLVPLMIGANDVAFPRLNAFSLWVLLFGGLLLHFSFIGGGAPDAGWFAYPPYSEREFSTTPGVNYWCVSLFVMGIGSVAGAINFVVTIAQLRAPGMTYRRLPVFVWMILITSFIILFALPSLNATVIMLFFDRQLGSHFFRAIEGGSALLYQHYFWSFGHPEVYILILPFFGIISEVIPVFTRKPLYGYAFVVGSSLAIMFYSFAVWGHHMWAAGMGFWADVIFIVGTMAIAVPTGVKIFNWLATTWGGQVRFTTPMLFALAFLVQFPIGGVTGVQFAVVPFDRQVTDTYYLVAHLHYVLYGGTVFAVFAGFYYWFPKVTGRLLSERLGKLTFWLMVVGFNGTFFIQHVLGWVGMPRRVYTYPDLPGWGLMNLVSTIGAFIIALSVLSFLVNVVHGLRRGAPAGDNPWDAHTLEWATSSPPPLHNFAQVPPVRGRRPLWDLAHPELADHRRAERGDGRQGDARAAATQQFATMDPHRFAMLLFLGGEVIFFGLLILAYVYYRGQWEEVGGPTAAVLDVPLTALFTTLLLASSLTIWLAERSLARGNRRMMQGWLFVTVALGAAFLVGQGFEWAQLFAEGITISSGLFGTTFFTLTGFHGFHVFMGLVALAIILVLALAGWFRGPHSSALAATSLYWHFVDIVWVAVFSVVYLWEYLS